MRHRYFLLGCFASVAGAAIAAQACGGDTSESSPAPDAGLVDAPVDTGAKKDTGPPVEEDAATCDLSADFTNKIPDASIADGASTTGLCVGCAKASCSKEVAACNADCPCQTIAADAIDCFAKKGDPLQCGSGFFGVPKKTQDIGIGLFTCIAGSCKTECATDSLLDGGADAPTD